ncbi:fibroleukin [Sardina pilchardus]|uniref:fibroleukin n=1 Tax=Sardina pilchardus TaxID=27697 RepID=UPI002E1494D0
MASPGISAASLLGAARVCACVALWIWLSVCACGVCVWCQRDTLVAAPTQRCEGGCRASPPRTDRPKPTEVVEVTDRLVQLQRCMRSLSSPGSTAHQRGQGSESESLSAILALMASVLLECDLHCHSNRLQEVAQKLEGAAAGRDGERDLLLLLKSITHTTQPPTMPPSSGLHPQDCAEIYRWGIKENGIYTIQPNPQLPAIEAMCDMETDGGGWTVFQRRLDGSESFNRSWAEYRQGFGRPQGEYWLGNAALHTLTANGRHTLRIHLQDWHKHTRHATYSTFRVASEALRFRLTVKGYSGDAGNALSYNKRYNHDGRAFSTYDRDHDRYTTGNCARYYGAGWWFDACLAANLNGRYYHGRYSGLTDGIYWGSWYILTDARSGERYSFKTVQMMTRRRVA